MFTETNKVIFFLLISLLTLQSCEKDRYHEIDKEVRDYFDYQEGSYWIFYDTKNSKTDSVYITDYENYFDGFFYAHDFEEGISISMNSYFYITLTIDNIYISTFETRFVLKYINKNFIGVVHKNNDIILQTEILKIDSIYQNNILYNNILVIFEGKDSLFVSKKIGPIKIVNEDNVYLLIRKSS